MGKTSTKSSSPRCAGSDSPTSGRCTLLDSGEWALRAHSAWVTRYTWLHPHSQSLFGSKGLLNQYGWNLPERSMAVLKSAWLSKTNECNKNWARTSRNGLRARLRFCSSITSAVSRLDEREIRWESQGTGPVEESEWMSVSNTPDNRYLIIRSPEEEFPEDALNEIQR